MASCMGSLEACITSSWAIFQSNTVAGVAGSEWPVIEVDIRPEAALGQLTLKKWLAPQKIRSPFLQHKIKISFFSVVPCAILAYFSQLWKWISLTLTGCKLRLQSRWCKFWLLGKGLRSLSSHWGLRWFGNACPGCQRLIIGCQAH